MTLVPLEQVLADCRGVDTARAEPGCSVVGFLVFPGAEERKGAFHAVFHGKNGSTWASELRTSRITRTS